MKDREITIKVLLQRVVLAWRFVLVLAVIFAIATPILKYKYDEKKYNENSANAQETVGSMSARERSQADVVYGYYLQLYTCEEQLYRPIMQLNFDNVRTVCMCFRVDILDSISTYTDAMMVGDSNKAASIAAAYNNCFESDDFLVELDSVLGLNTSLTYVSEFRDIWYTGDCFYIYVRLPEGIEANQVSDKVFELINKMHEEGAYSDDYELVCEYNFTTSRKRLDLKEQYNNLIIQRFSFNESIENSLKILTPEQLYYISCMQNGVEYSPSVTPAPVFEKPTLSKKMAVLGFAGGIGIAIVLNLLGTILSSHIISVEEFRHLYAIEAIGPVWGEKGLSKLLCSLSHFFSKLFGNNYNYDERIEQAAGMIALKCKGLNISSVAITGTKLNRVSDAVKDKLIADLKDKGIKAELAADAMNDYNSMKSCADCDGVVIMEVVNKSSYNDINNEITKLNSYEVKIISAVIVGLI